MSAQRKPIDISIDKVTYAAHTFEPEYIPKVGLTPFEVSSNAIHPGTEIFNVIDTSSMGESEILKTVSSLDNRALVNMPQEVIDEIKAGNITHIFQTDPSGTMAFQNLPDDVQDSLKGKGSIYFRTKEGKTARFKLPEVATDDAGWNANKGGHVFMDQSIYTTKENIKSLNDANAVSKKVQRGTLQPYMSVDDSVAKGSFIDQILSKSKEVTGSKTITDAGTGVAPAPVTTGPTPGSVPSGPTVTTGPTAGSVPSGPTVTTGETPGRKPIGRPVTTANTPSPPPTATQARETAEKVTKSGNATPPPKATIQSTAPTPSRPSSGAPVKSPGRLRTAADDLSAAVTQGPNGARNLKMLGIAGALGVAGFALSRGRGSAQDDEATRRRLEMQRRGTM